MLNNELNKNVIAELEIDNYRLKVIMERDDSAVAMCKVITKLFKSTFKLIIER